MKITKIERIIFQSHYEPADTEWTARWRRAHGDQFRAAHMACHDQWGVLRIESDSGHIGAWTGEAVILTDFWECGLHKYGFDPAQALVGRNVFHREAIWQDLLFTTHERVAGALDTALWDLAGQITGLPAHQLAGQCRERIPVYVTSPLNYGTPEDYAEYAVACKRRGYLGFKIHPYSYYDPVKRRPDPGVQSSPDYDIEVCRQTRAAVGPDYPLMLDSCFVYNYEDAVRVGRAIEELGFVWYESPLPDKAQDDIAVHARLAAELDIPLCVPEFLPGATFSRMKWLKQSACDIMRTDVEQNGITATLKMAAICEAWPMPLELHGDYYPNITVLAATNEKTVKYLEWWDLDPDRKTPNGFAKPETHLIHNMGMMDDDGYFAAPQRPGIGYVIDWDFVYRHRIGP